jgi:molybdenum cofactor synthesis domain-containing protein
MAQAHNRRQRLTYSQCTGFLHSVETKLNQKAANSQNDHEVCGSGFKHLTPVREALQIVLSRLPKKSLGVEAVPLPSALGRILAQDVVSQSDVPSFDKAAMDGFAVIAEDTYGATPTAPVFLRSLGRVQIGTVPMVRVKKGEAVSIVTGGRMPQGANAVVMIEYTNEREDGTVEISGEVHPTENVALIGEDVRKGTTVLKKGTRLLPQDLGMLTGLGLNQITVIRKPRVAVLSTGTELQDQHSVSSNSIQDVNRPILVAALRELGCEPVDLGIVSDEFEKIRGRLKQGIAAADVVLVTAGTSVGPGDIVPKVINSLGKPGMLVHGVAMRPSMPTGLAVVDGKLVVSLPGYPVSAYIAFLEFVQPLITDSLETGPMPRPAVKARLTRRVTGVLGSRTYVRVLVTRSDEGYIADPVRTSGAGILSSLVQANGFVIIPEHTEGYEEQQEVEVELFRPPERQQIAK